MLNKELTVGQLAARSGVAVTALHFYETKGLIKSNRNAGNQRRYPRDVLRRVVVIKIAQRLGIALATIGEALQSDTAKHRRTHIAQYVSSANPRASERCTLCHCMSAVQCVSTDCGGSNVGGWR